MRAAILIAMMATSTAAIAAVSISDDDASEWTSQAKADGMGVVFIHETSIKSHSAPTSSIAFYRIPASDPDIVKFRETFAKDGMLQKQFAPETCYLINQKELVSRQTWCEASSKWMVVIAEIGPEKMSETEKSHELFDQIAEAKK